MFGNFLYFIVILLIYSTYQPPEQTSLNFLETMGLALFLLALFYGITRRLFQGLERQIRQQPSPKHVHQFESLMTRQSIMAVTFYALHIYGLSLPKWVQSLPVFYAIPTLAALVFVVLFMAYLSIIWMHAHGCHRLLNDDGVSRKEYIRSNIAFSIPVILPWFALSIVSDFIFLMPVPGLQEALSSPLGQAVYFLFFLITAAVVAPVMIQKFWGCTPLEPGFHRSLIEAGCHKAGVSYTDILRWPLFGGRMITAGVMGLVKRFRYILVTPALLQYLSPMELEAVIAHEIGHIKKKHLVFYLLFLAGYMLISFAGFDLFLYGLIYLEPAARLIVSLGVPSQTLYPILVSVCLILFFVLYFRFFFGFFMRNFERQADIYVYNLMETAQPLISSLRGIALISGHPMDKPNWHHFSIAERIGYLEKCETDRQWVHRHNRKVTSSISLFAVGMVLIAMAAYDLNFGTTGKRLSHHAFETLLMRNCRQVIDAYEDELHAKPGTPEILNNLAWIYATSENAECRNPPKALLYAKMAVQIQADAYILDTLAQACFANGLIREAIAYEKKALSLASDEDRYIYEKQLEKFLKENSPQ